MKQSLNRKTAVASINEHGLLLVFPIDNATQPPSLWSVAYPRSKMRWEWDDSGDNRVANLWHLREELSRSGDVIYTKWYRGRATFFSRPVFTALLSLFLREPLVTRSLSQEAKDILEVLEADSPLSTKALKRAVGLQGRENEALYTRALKELWSRLLIVAYGEVDEGAFPSLAIGATQVLFEDLYNQAQSLSLDKAKKLTEPLLGESSQVERFFRRTLLSFQERPRVKPPQAGYIEFIE